MMRACAGFVVTFWAAEEVPPEVTIQEYTVDGDSPVTMHWWDVPLAATPLSMAALPPAVKLESDDTSVVHTATMVVSVFVKVNAEITAILGFP
jgi:hypothetical protein